MTAEVVNNATSAGKALAILDCFRSGERRIGLTELSRRTGIPKSSVHRLCEVLVESGYLCRTDDRSFSLGLRVFELGGAATPRVSAHLDASRYLQQLTLLTGETSHLGVLADLDVVYIDKVETPTSNRVPSRVGQRNPAYTTALGKALLASSPEASQAVFASTPLPAFTRHTLTSADSLRKELADVATAGVALDREERALGVACVAAPVRNRGSVVASLSVTGPAARILGERLPQIAHVVRATAAEMSRSMCPGRPFAAAG